MRIKIIYILSALCILLAFGAVAQVNDNFSDGNFTENPAWTGDTDKFAIAPYVLDESNLVLRSNNNGAATYYLSTPSSIVEETFWEFFINLRFSVTGANFVDAYLVADNANLTTVQNGYFLRFGRTQKDISFWRKQGGTDQLLFEGPANQINSSTNNPFNIRATRTSDGLWSILADQGATGTYQLLGVVNDNTFTTTVAFGFRIVQSTAAGPVNNHWFDNVVVAPIPPDVTPPQVINAEATSATSVTLTFDEPLNATTAGNAANYSVDGGIGTPSSAVFNTTTLVSVVLQLPSPLAEGQAYTITVSGVQDLAGNAMPGQGVPVVWFTIATPSYREVVFNELMVDENPPVGLPQAEFIELFNTTTDKFFDLSGWSYVNNTTVRTLGFAILPPNSYLLLCNTNAVALFQPFGQVQGVASWPALTNTADSLTLISPGGEIIDIVSYTSAWYQDPTKADGGWTLEQINPLNPCSGMPNWRAAEHPSGGTPGAVNSIFDDSPDTEAPAVTGFSQASPDVVRVLFSEIMDEQSLLSASYTLTGGISVVDVMPESNFMAVNLTLNEPLEVGIAYALTINGPSDCAGNGLAANTVINILFGERPQFMDLVISEIMADPTPAVGLPAQEYFELFNASDKVIDIQGCSISGVSFIFPRLLQPGEYLMCVSSNALEDFTGFPDAYVMQGMSLTFLTNGGRELTLNNQDGELVNTVAYSSTWYRDPAKADGGWSLEIINPFTECSGAQNWIASNAVAGGTPGTQNSVFNDTPDTAPPSLLGFTAESPDIVVLRFNELMDVESLVDASYLFSDGIGVLAATPFDPPTEVQLELSEPLVLGQIYSLTVNGPLDCSLNPLPETTITVQLGDIPGLHDLLITEIMADPTPAVGLPEAEYFELYNASDKVLQLQGLKMSTLIFGRQRLVQPGEYVICAAENNRQEFFAFQGVYFIDDMSTTFLTNGGREMLLTTGDNETVDRVNYSLSWYGDRSKEDGGWSLERINLLEPCRAGDNWIASVDTKGGTPGAVNSVNNTVPDTTPPLVTFALVVQPTEVEVRFSEVIDPLSIVPGAFSIDGPGVIAAQAIAPDNVSASLLLSTSLGIGNIYTLTITGVSDCVGNPMVLPLEVAIAVPEEGEPGDVVINEVLFNVGTGEMEFVEVVNVSDKAVGLKDWSVLNQNLTSRVITTDPLVIFPGAYMVFTPNPDVLMSQYPLGKRENMLAVDVPQLTNSAGAVIIYDATNTPIDRFDYQESFHLSLLRSFRGVSLERLSFTRPSNDPGNWTSAAESAGFATPGYLNSQFLPEGTSSGGFELDNEVFSPDNDGFQDVLLINYKTDNPGYIANVQIFDRRGRLIHILTSNQIIGTQGTLSWDGTTDNGSKARIGPHIIYIELFDLNGNKEVFKLPCIVAGRLSN